MFESYRNRVHLDGKGQRDGLINSTKRQVTNYIQNSPSKSQVDVYHINKQLDDSYKVELSVADQMTIVSEKETIYKQKILFTPDNGFDIGTYIKYGKRMYLLTEMSEIDGYPNGLMELCNFPLTVEYGEGVKIPNGKDDRGRPLYKTVKPIIELPTVVDDKIYSELNNSQMPLPEGAIILKIPYHPIVQIKTNDILTVFGNEVQATTVSPTHLLLNETGQYYGYYEIRCGRKQGKHE